MIISLFRRNGEHEMTDYISGYEGKGHYQREARDVANRLRTEATRTSVDRFG